jgi:hypothetical protein
MPLSLASSHGAKAERSPLAETSNRAWTPLRKLLVMDGASLLFLNDDADGVSGTAVELAPNAKHQQRTCAGTLNLLRI